MPFGGYGQYCPLALAAEVLCERWTLLVVSRLVDGCRRFNEIHRGVPKISPTLLKQRLIQLEDAGLVTRKPLSTGRGHEYLLTQAGRELEPIIMDIAVWGQRWSRDMINEDLDPAFLAWSMHSRMNLEALPEGRTVIAFEFSGTHHTIRNFWLVAEDREVDMCLKDPGHPVDVTVRADIRRFVEAWRGFRNLKDEIALGRIDVDGPTEMRRRLPEWLLMSALAPFPRERHGSERTAKLQSVPAAAE